MPNPTDPSFEQLQVLAAHLHLAGALRAEAAKDLSASFSELEARAQKHEERARMLLRDWLGAAPSAGAYASAIVGVES